MSKKTKKENIQISHSLSAMAWKRMKRNVPAMMGLWFILLSIVVSVLGATIRPDQSEDAATGIQPIAKKKPGFNILMLKVRKNEDIPDKPWYKKLLFGYQDNQYSYYPINGDNYEFDGTNIVIEQYIGDKKENDFKSTRIPFNIADVVYPLHRDNRYTEEPNGKISFYDVHNNKIVRDISELQKEIKEKYIFKKTFWLGTDTYGRDMLSRVQAGTIVSLSVGLISVLISLIIGISLGAIAGYYRGWADDVIMWIINVVWSIPTLLLVIAVTIALGKGFWQVFVAVGLTMWVEVARIVRGQVLSIREKEFVEAAKALGYNSWRIITKHVLPSVLGPVIVISAANFASAILIESGLSFLGVGVQPPMPSWGAMVAKHRDFINTDFAYLAVVPGICIMLIVLAFMMVGNGLRDALDTRAIEEVKG
jgi:peptide/nickel transport system permease protein